MVIFECNHTHHLAKYRKDEFSQEYSCLSVTGKKSQLPESMTFDDYVSVDQDVQTHEEITESDIIAELQSGPMELEEEEEDDVEIVEEQTKVCSFAEAKSFMHELRRYFESSTKTTD